MALFDSITGQLVKEGIQKLREEAERARQHALAELEDFFYGGSRTKQYLTQNSGENNARFDIRKKRFAHFGYSGFVGRQLVSALYGRSVKRVIGTEESNENKLYEDLLRENRIESKQRLVGVQQVVTGSGIMLVACPREQDVKLHPVDPSHFYVERDPDDPYRMLTAVEERVNPNKPEEPAYWIWTVEQYRFVDAAGNDLPWTDGFGQMHRGWVANPYERIPYVYWRGWPMVGEFWGASLLADVVQLNKLINNRASQLDRIVLYQAHAQPWIKGATQPEKLTLSEDKAIGLSEEGEFGYAVPGADIANTITSLKELERTLIALSGLPSSVIVGGSATSGYQLEVEYRTMRDVVRDLQVEAETAEQEMAEVVCAVGLAHGLKLPEDPEVTIEFNSDFLPRDSAAEREQDRADWRDGLLSTEDYVRRWVLPEDATPEQVTAYVAQLAQQKQAQDALARDKAFAAEGGSVL